jgi:hypothetical protein
MLSAWNAFERSKRIEQEGDRHAFAERLDADVTRTSLIAERRVQRYKIPEWLMELLDNARKKVSALSKILSMAKTGVDHTHIVGNEMLDSYLLLSRGKPCDNQPLLSVTIRSIEGGFKGSLKV